MLGKTGVRKYVFCAMLVGAGCSTHFPEPLATTTEGLSTTSRNWSRMYGSTATEIVYGSAADSDGNVYAVGQTLGVVEHSDAGSASSYDSFIVKYNRNGDEVWVAQFTSTAVNPGYDWDFPFALATYGGHVYVTGRTRGYFPGFTSDEVSDVFVVKYTTDGVYEGAAQFSANGTGVGDALGYGIVADSSGVYVTGYSHHDFTADLAFPRATGMVNPPDSQCAASGSIRTCTSSSTMNGILVFKLDTSLAMQWFRVLGSSSYAYGHAVTLDSNGVYVAAQGGSNISNGSGGYLSTAGGLELYVGGFDKTTGDTLWQAQYGTTGNDVGTGITTDGSGNLFVSGTTTATMPGLFESAWRAGTHPDNDIFVMQLNASDGSRVETHELIGLTASSTSGEDISSGIAFSSDGTSVIVGGRTTGFLNNNLSSTLATHSDFSGSDFFLARYAYVASPSSGLSHLQLTTIKQYPVHQAWAPSTAITLTPGTISVSPLGDVYLPGNARGPFDGATDDLFGSQSSDGIILRACDTADLSCPISGHCSDTPSPCPSGTVCAESSGLVTCTCPSGFLGNMRCEDINECQSLNPADRCQDSSGNPSPAHNLCTNTDGSASCGCASDYTLVSGSCVDNCTLNNGGCSPNATCSHVNGKVTCACNAGYQDATMMLAATEIVPGRECVTAQSYSTSDPFGLRTITPEDTVSQWSAGKGGSGNDYSSAVAFTKGGHILLTGQLRGTGSYFDGFFSLIANDPSFPSGYGAEVGGGLPAVVDISTTDYCSTHQTTTPRAIAADSRDRQIIAGETRGQLLSFSDNPNNVYYTSAIANNGIDSLPSCGNPATFITKYDALGTSGTTPLWTHEMAANSSAYGLAVDSHDDIVVAGTTAGPFLNLASNGGYDAYVMKLDTNGNLLWAQLLGSHAGTEQANAVAVDGDRNVYIAGQATADLGGSQYHAPSSGATPDGFLAKYDSSGNLKWVQEFGTTGSEIVTSVAVLDTGSSTVIYLAGTTDAGYDSGGSSSTKHVFVETRSASDGTLVHSSYLALSLPGGGSTLTDNVNSIAVDSAGTVFLVGQSTGTSGGSTTLPVALYVGSLDSSLTPVMLKQWVSAVSPAPQYQDGKGTGIAVGPRGDLAVAYYQRDGSGSGHPPLFPGLPTRAVSGGGGSDAYVMRLQTRDACPLGYSVSTTDFACDDIDECSGSSPCLTGSCTNEEGTYICKSGSVETCHRGPGVCIPESCTTDNGGCWCQDSSCDGVRAFCSNTVSGASCACPPGMSGNGISCSDVDACATANGGCGSGEICLQGQDGVECLDGSIADCSITSCASGDTCTAVHGKSLCLPSGSETFAAATVPACPSLSTPVLTHYPLDPSRIRNIDRLGMFSPPSHIMPISHTYIYPSSDEAGAWLRSPVAAPAQVTIISISDHGTSTHSDFQIEFIICEDGWPTESACSGPDWKITGVYGRLNHLGALSDILQERFDLYVSHLSTTPIPFPPTTIPAGGLIGYTGAHADNAFDFGLIDTRREPFLHANEDRYWGLGKKSLRDMACIADDYPDPDCFGLAPMTLAEKNANLVPLVRNVFASEGLFGICPYDDYGPSQRQAMINLISRTGADPAASECGTISYDSKLPDHSFSMAGQWFGPASDQGYLNGSCDSTPLGLVHPHTLSASDDVALVLGRSSIRQFKGRISIGGNTSVSSTGIASDEFDFADCTSGGHIDCDYTKLPSTSSDIYCYPHFSGKVLLVQADSSGNLLAELKTAASCPSPLAMTSPVTLTR